MADCKSYKMKKMLFRKLCYLYCDQNYVPENELITLMNTKSSFLSEELQITHCDVSACLENDNNKCVVIKNNINFDVKENNDQLSHGNESLLEHICQPINKQTKRKSSDAFPDSVRNHIQHYEAKSSCTHPNINTDKTCSTKISILPEGENVITKPPVVVGMILKAKVGEFRITPTMVEEQLEVDASLVNTCSSMKFNSSTLSNKDKCNERFIINLIEPKVTTQNKINKISNNSLISMSSELFIQDLSMEHNGSSGDTAEDFSGSTNNSFSASLEVMKKINKQRQIIKQAGKAVQACRTSNYFQNSLQRAEAERILLTASLKRDHLLMQLQHLHELDKNTADLTISNIKFPFNVDEIVGTHRTWFLVTCATESTFHISPMLELSSKSSCLKLPNMYTFEGVPPNFQIKLCVYELTVSEANEKKKSQFSQKFKKKLLRNRSNSIVQDRIGPSFKVCGWIDLTLDNFKSGVLDLKKNTTKSLFSVVHFSGSAFSLVLNEKRSGFITIGFEVNGYVVWDKNWCNLFNSVLHFWSNPSEESLNDSKRFIDLRNCVIGSSEHMCLRKNTLVLESACVGENVNARRYYLSCDSVEDFNSWTGYITSILDTFRHWKSLMYV